MHFLNDLFTVEAYNDLIILYFHQVTEETPVITGDGLPVLVFHGNVASLQCRKEFIINEITVIGATLTEFSFVKHSVFHSFPRAVVVTPLIVEILPYFQLCHLLVQDLLLPRLLAAGLYGTSSLSWYTVFRHRSCF